MPTCSSFCCQNLPQPTIWAEQVLQEYSGKPRVPPYIKNIKSNIRSFQRTRSYFSKGKKSYNAYKRDIAVLKVLAQVLYVNSSGMI